jgi:hypothetical protein
MQRNRRAVALSAPFLVTLAALMAVSVLPPAPARAELPPSAYEAMRKDAPLVAEIVVRQVEVRSEPGKGAGADPVRTDRVTVLAEVTRAVRTPPGKAAPKQARIRYEIVTHAGGWAGPGPVPLLTKGTRYRAYLSPEKGGGLRPAAGSHSFDPLPAAPKR